MKKHLAIFKKEAVREILSGRKLIEIRASIKRIAPYNQVSVGDIIYIKPPGQEIVAQFEAKKVIFFEGLEPSDWKIIRELFKEKISLGSSENEKNYFDSKTNAKFATIVYIDKVEQFITPPIKISKSDQRGWVVLK